MKPQEKDYVSHVSYARALEAYCENLEKFIEGKNGYKERIQQLYEENLRLGNEQIDLADKTREECAQVCEGVVCGSQGMAGPSRCILKPGHDGAHSYGVPMAKTQRECAAEIRAMKERP